MTTAASAGAYLLSTPEEFGPNLGVTRLIPRAPTQPLRQLLDLATAWRTATYISISFFRCYSTMLALPSRSALPYRGADQSISHAARSPHSNSHCIREQRHDPISRYLRARWLERHRPGPQTSPDSIALARHDSLWHRARFHPRP